MPISPELERRYRALFQVYGAGGSPQMVRLKGRIAEQESILREDAMYFLLVSMDHMVIQAISGYVPSVESGMLTPPMAEFSTPDEVDRMVTRSLEAILAELDGDRRAADKPKSSANDVIRAIHVQRDKLSDIILWWKE